MDRSPKQLQELTLALLYLTSLQDHDDPAGRRCWKGYDFQVLEDLKAQGLLQDTQGRIPLRLPQEGVARAQAVLATLGMEDLVPRPELPKPPLPPRTTAAEGAVFTGSTDAPQLVYR